MGTAGEKIIKILQYEMKDIAQLEERRFQKSSGDRLIFIRKTYLLSHYPESRSSVNNHRPVDTPLSLSEELRKQFVSIFELEKFLSKPIYNQLLKELLTNAKGFDQINIVFDHILAYKHYQAETINFIISYITSNWELRNSFQVQNGMPKLVLNNLHLIESSLTKKFISDFPRPNNLISPDFRNQYETTMDIIMKSTGDNTDDYRPKKKS